MTSIRARGARRGVDGSSGQAKLFALSGLTFLAFAASAQTEEITNPFEKLDVLEEQISRGRQDILETKRSAEQLAKDENALRSRLIQVAASAQNHERDLNLVEQKLANFETREAEAMKSLSKKRDHLASMLAVLQRMGNQPPPALIVHPRDATSAARSAMLLTGVVPNARNEALKLAQELLSLRRLRQHTARERLRVAAAANALQKDRTQILQLIEQRRNMIDHARSNIEAAKANVSNLATQASDLQQLITSLNDEAQRPQLRNNAEISRHRALGPVENQSQPLDRFRGQLRLPAVGDLYARFGSPDPLGGRLSGIYLLTQDSAQVTSPCDGKILFAGPFRGYGGMLIISTNGGYHILLAGLERLESTVGQLVLAGEPLGMMARSNSTPNPQDGKRDSRSSRPRLYIEFRRNGVPIDPVPWFAAYKGRVSG